MAKGKGLAVAILSKLPPPGERGKPAPKPAEDDDAVGYESAAADIRAAIKSGDDAALAEALREFVTMCK